MISSVFKDWIMFNFLNVEVVLEVKGFRVNVVIIVLGILREKVLIVKDEIPLNLVCLFFCFRRGND